MDALRVGLATLAMAFGYGMLAPFEAQAQRRDRDLITREELIQSAQKSQDLHQAIRSLRPHFLAGPRGTRSMPADPPLAGQEAGRGRQTGQARPVVYLDGNRLGELDVLSSLLTVNVEDVRYLNPNQAMIQLGPGHEGGAIMVRMYKALQPGIPDPPPPPPPA